MLDKRPLREPGLNLKAVEKRAELASASTRKHVDGVNKNSNSIGKAALG